MNRFWSVNRRLRFEDRIIKQNPNKIVVIYSPDMLQFYKGTSFIDFAIVDFFLYAFLANDYTFSEHQKYLLELNKKLKKINNYVKEIDFLNEEK